MWSKSTDDVRSPKVDKVTMTVFANPDDADQRLKAGDVDLEADGGVQATFQTQIEANPSLKKYADNPATGFTRYLVVFQTVAPLTNVDCRKAIFYAIDKSDLQLARGGSSAGTIAPSMTPPGIPGYQSEAQYDPYPDGTGDTGDVTKAKAELAKCGQPNGFTINEAYTPGGKADAVLAATQNALKRVGIVVKPLPGEQASYYSTFIGAPADVIAKKIGLAQAAWGPDFPTLNGFYQNIVSGGAIKASGTSNYASLNDPTVNQAIDQAGQTTDTAALEQLGQTINHGVMDNAVYLPYLWDSAFYYRNPRLTNVYLTPGTGFFYDYVNIGVSDGK
jgi:peptide/nickel transport system substrate-binding protein